MLSDKLPLLSFSSPSAFKRWLTAQPRNSQGAWLKFAKKGAAEATISKSDAIDLALAHGWIDGQLGRVDEFYFKTRFTPRKPKSAWSKINCERAERLIVSGQMTQQGWRRLTRQKRTGDGKPPTHRRARPLPTLIWRQRWMMIHGFVRCLTLWTRRIATPLSIGFTKQRPPRSVRRRSRNSWPCFVAAKRSIRAASNVPRIHNS